MKMKMLIPSGMIGLLLTLTGNTRAAPLAYEFTGTIHTVDDSRGILNSSVQEGSEFSGWFTFDTKAVDLDPSPNHGEYRDPLFSYALSVGTYAGSSSGEGVVFVTDNLFGGDRLVINGGAFPIGQGLSVSGFGGYLTDDTAGAFSSDSIPSEPFPTSAFQSLSFFTKGYAAADLGGGSFTLVGTFSTFNVVPEATALPFVLWGLLACRARRIETH
jgi:hypothetical protein